MLVIETLAIYKSVFLSTCTLHIKHWLAIGRVSIPAAFGSHYC